MAPHLSNLARSVTAALTTSLLAWAVDVWIPQLTNQTYLELERE